MLSLSVVSSMVAVLVISFVFLFVCVGVGYIIFSTLYAPKISNSEAYDTNQHYLVATYASWFLSSLLEAGMAIVFVGFNSLYQLYTFLLSVGILYVAVTLALPVATMWTAYHDTAFEVVINLWACGVDWLTMDFQLYRLLNVARLLLDVGFPFVRFIGRIGRLLLRTNIFVLLQCVGFTLLNLLIYAVNGVTQLVLAFITWFTAHGSIITNQLNTTAAFGEFTRANTVALRILDCGCKELDFLWIIGLEWVGSPYTSKILSTVVAGAAEGIVQMPFRTLLGQNQGTNPTLPVPYKTGNYRYLPNLNTFFDIAVNLTDPGAQLINHEIYIIIRELVGVFNPNIFTPGSQAEIILASDWLGFAGELVAAAIEWLRVMMRGWTAAFAAGVQLAVLAFSAILVSPLYISVFGPQLLCDIREWRAIVDFGGGSSLYHKTGGILGHIDQALVRLGNVLGVITPYLPPLVIPFGRIIVAWFGMLTNGPVRLFFHLIDSEWRMYSPPLPPTGVPLTYWVAAPGLGPPPVPCPATYYPGFFIPWVQSYYMEQGAFFDTLSNQLDTVAEGWGNLTGLVTPVLGVLVKNLISVPIRAVDAFIQTSLFLNVILFEPLEKKAIFFSMWKAYSFFQTLGNVGNALANLIFMADTVTQCTQPDPLDNWFCGVGNATRYVFVTGQDIGYQLVGLVVTSFVPPFKIPNFDTVINDLTLEIRSLIATVLIIVPPFKIGTQTLTIVVIRLMVTAAPVVTFPLWVGNYLLLSIQTAIGNNINTTVDSVITGITSFFKQFVTGVFQKFLDVFGTGVLLQFMSFIDVFVTNPAIPADGLFYKIGNAILSILTIVVALTSTYVLQLFEAIFVFIGALIDLVFNTSGGNTSISTRIGNFVAALASLVVRLIFSAPFLLLQLLFGILGAILPEPLRTIIITIGQLLTQGLCYIIQTFIDIVFGIINLFGANLVKPNLCCSGDASCVPTKRSIIFGDSEIGPQQKRQIDVWQETLRANLTEWASKVRLTQKNFREREERLRTVADKYFGAKRKRQAAEPLSTDAGLVVDTTLYTPLFGLNESSVNSSVQHLNEVIAPMSMNDAILVVAESVPWTGNSACDQLLNYIEKRGQTGTFSYEGLGILEQITLHDCVTKRTIGEIVSVMPYLTWFPVDGFYNPMTWINLGIRGFKAYTIYMQWTNDRNLPREIVLSANYSASWAAKGMNVSHLKPELYATFINWTLDKYFVHNNGDLELADAVLSYYNAMQKGLGEQANYFHMLSDSLMNSNESDILNWINGTEYMETHLLNPDLMSAQAMWRAMLTIATQTMNLTVQVSRTIYDSNITSMSLQAATYIPGAVKNAYTFFTTYDQNVEWQEAVKKRNLLVFGQEQVPTVTSSAIGLVAVSVERAISDLTNWFWGRLDTLRQNLRPNSPRALRNRNIISHLFSSAIRGPDNVTAPPPGLAVEQVPVWQAMVLKAQGDNRAATTRSRFLLHKKVNTYATGGSIRKASTSPVIGASSFLPAVQVCNLSLVPICFNCYLLDALLDESALSYNQVVESFAAGGEWSISYDKYLYFDAYINRNATAKVCGGTGSLPILWPSDAYVWRDYTLFEIIGGNDPIISFWSWLKGQIPALGSLVNSTAATDLIVHRINGLANRIGRIGKATESTRIYDYAMTHESFDATFWAYDLIPPVKPYLRVLDSVASFFGDFSFSLDTQFDTNTNTTLTMPSFGGNGSVPGSGFIGYIWSNYIEANYDYQCGQRNMTLLQGVLLTALFYVILSVFLTLTVGYVSGTLSMVIMAIAMLLLPYGFFVLVYNYPVQNLFFLPLPVPPPCFVDDVAEALFCDVVPKCPGVFSGLIDGPYTEQNCNVCPSTLNVRNFKTDFAINDGIDWVVLFVRWFYPPLIDLVQSVVGQGTPLGTLLSPLHLETRLDKFANIDFADRATFNAYITALLVMLPGVVPGLIWTFITVALFFSAVFLVVFQVLQKVAVVFYVMALLTQAMWTIVYVSFVFAVTDADVAVLQMAMQQNAKRIPRISTPDNDRVEEEDGDDKKKGSKRSNKYSDARIPPLWARGLAFVVDRLVYGSGIRQIFASFSSRKAAAEATDARAKRSKERQDSKARVYVDHKYKKF